MKVLKPVYMEMACLLPTALFIPGRLSALTRIQVKQYGNEQLAPAFLKSGVTLNRHMPMHLLLLMADMQLRFLDRKAYIAMIMKEIWYGKRTLACLNPLLIIMLQQNGSSPVPRLFTMAFW